MPHFILVADTINSSDKLAEELISDFKEVILVTNKQSEILSKSTVTLGDEYQGVVKKMKDSFEIIFRLDEICGKPIRPEA